MTIRILFNDSSRFLAYPYAVCKLPTNACNAVDEICQRAVFFRVTQNSPSKPFALFI
nr:MAG TPA: hypothetical protein [Caudoviricetes sp.]